MYPGDCASAIRSCRNMLVSVPIRRGAMPGKPANKVSRTASNATDRNRRLPPWNLRDEGFRLDESLRRNEEATSPCPRICEARPQGRLLALTFGGGVNGRADYCG